jgi:hypothetical protein
MRLKRTPCCAMLFMIAKDWDSLGGMYKILLKKQKQLNQVTHWGYGKGETTIQVVVTNAEKNLKKNLIKLGFKKKFNFDRRRVSNEDQIESNKDIPKTQLSMYVLELKNLKNPLK